VAFATVDNFQGLQAEFQFKAVKFPAENIPGENQIHNGQQVEKPFRKGYRYICCPNLSTRDLLEVHQQKALRWSPGTVVRAFGRCRKPIATA